MQCNVCMPCDFLSLLLRGYSFLFLSTCLAFFSFLLLRDLRIPEHSAVVLACFPIV